MTPLVIGQTVDYPITVPNFTKPDLLQNGALPKPLHGLNPRTLFGQNWWDGMRNTAFRDNNYCCWACGVSKYHSKPNPWLEGHEVYDVDWRRGRMEFEGVVALCGMCHAYIHRGSIVFKGGSADLQKAIVEHGDKLLSDVGLVRWDMGKLTSSIKWSDWRLIIAGKEYKPLWRNIEHWRANYGDKLDPLDPPHKTQVRRRR